jgi:DNA-binding NarL/FixJ family response regulator
MTRIQLKPVPPKSRKVSVLVAEESAARRSGLREALEALDGVEVIGEAGTTHDALAVFFRLQPKAVVVSICLPGHGGFYALRCIKRAVPDCDVILSSRWPHPFVQETGRLLGASTVCSLGNGYEEVLDAVESLVQPLRPRPCA